MSYPVHEGVDVLIFGGYQIGLNIKRPKLVFFLAPTKLSNYIDRQVRTRDTVLIKRREMTARAKHCRGKGYRKDNKKHNPLAPLSVTWEILSHFKS